MPTRYCKWETVSGDSRGRSRIRLYKTKNPLHVFGLGMVMVTLGLFFSTVAFYGNASINQEARDYLKNIFLLYAGIGGNLVASWVLMRK